MNTVCLSGKIQEIRYSPKCTYITLMITGQHNTEWIDVTLFEHQAKFFDKYFNEGKYVNIVGHLRKTKYKEQIKLECVADAVSFCGAKIEPFGTSTDLPQDWLLNNNHNQNSVTTQERIKQ